MYIWSVITLSCSIMQIARVTSRPAYRRLSTAKPIPSTGVCFGMFFIAFYLYVNNNLLLKTAVLVIMPEFYV